MTMLQFKIISICLLIGLASICQAQKSNTRLMTCQSLTEIKAQVGKKIRVIGRLKRSYRLPKAPYILLLPNKDWIFLGNYEVLKEVDTKQDFIMIEGVVKLKNTKFNLATFNNTPLDPLSSRYIDPELQEKEPAHIIQNQPYFSSIDHIQSMAICATPKDISQHIGHWVVLFGWLSADKNKVLHYRSTQQKFSIPMPSLATHYKNKLGMIVAKFDQQNTHPSEIISHRLLPICQSSEDIKKHLGEIVAISGKVKNKKINNTTYSLLKTSPRTRLYFYSSPAALVLQEMKGKKMQLIAGLQNYDAPTFFQLSYYFNRPSLGQQAYISKFFWWSF